MTKLASIIPLLLAAGSAYAQNSTVVPSAYETDPGTGSFLGPIHGQARTNQLIIKDTQLSDIDGQSITGISWRLPAVSTDPWPDETVTYFSYDILLGEGVDPSSRQFDFGANVIGSQTVVRTGELVISPFAFTGGAVPNEFGVDILFDTPWPYDGGNLVIEIIHTGHDAGFRSSDAVTTSTPGYLTDFAAIWQASQPAPVQGNFSIVKLITDGAPTCRPDLNGDGVVDADDFFEFLTLFADGDPRADFTDDGVIDADDFFEFLNEFATGC